MERLQAAIEKARATRGDEAEVKPRATTSPSKPTQPAPTAWDAIRPFEWSAKTLRKNRVVAFESGNETATYDMLRTRIIQQMRQNGWKRLAVTSPTSACGKTSTCCNLAASFGRQRDRRIIVFDLDMRRPTMAKVMGHRDEYSFSSVLEGKVSFGDQAVAFSSSVVMSMNYAPARDPSELILQDRMTDILQEIDDIYQPDLMIFDTPPLLASDDTLAVLRHVDGALLIAAAEATTIDQVDHCEKDLANHTNVVGVVVNKCRYADPNYGYEYGY